MERALAIARQTLVLARSNPFAWACLVLGFVTIALIWIWPGPMVDRVPSDTRLRLWALMLQLS